MRITSCLAVAVLLAAVALPAGAQTNFAGKDLSRRDLRTENFEDANLSDAKLDSSDLTDVILKNANLRNASLLNTRMGGADLSGADLRGSRFSAFVQKANFAGANMEGLDLQGVSFRSCDLRGANLRNAKGIADITYADLRGADLRGAYLLGARDYDGNSVKIEGAKYDRRTRFPQGLDVEKSGAVKEEEQAPPATPDAAPPTVAPGTRSSAPGAPALQLTSNAGSNAPPPGTTPSSDGTGSALFGTWSVVVDGQTQHTSHDVTTVSASWGPNGSLIIKPDGTYSWNRSASEKFRGRWRHATSNELGDYGERLVLLQAYEDVDWIAYQHDENKDLIIVAQLKALYRREFRSRMK